MSFAMELPRSPWLSLRRPWVRPALAMLVSAVALGVACSPHDRRPGTWLSGELVVEPVADWSFSDEAEEIFVETRTWYGIPHSVTTVCAADGAALYVPSVYFEGGEFPAARFWNRNVVRDPRVRLQIGDRLYERRAVVVEDAAEREVALAAFARKYPFWQELVAKPESERPRIFFFRMDPGEV
jgi:hypothetical protein